MKMKTIEDMDVITTRLVRAVIQEKQGEQAAKVGEVTDQEEKQTSKRMRTTKNWAFSFGPAGSSNLGSDGTFFHFSIAYVWGITPKFSLGVFWDRSGSTDDAADMHLLGVRGSYFFSEKALAHSLEHTLATEVQKPPLEKVNLALLQEFTWAINSSALLR